MSARLCTACTRTQSGSASSDSRWGVVTVGTLAACKNLTLTPSQPVWPTEKGRKKGKEVTAMCTPAMQYCTAYSRRSNMFGRRERKKLGRKN